MNYKHIKRVEVEATCVGITKYEWDKLMLGAVRANKKEIDRIVKANLPDLYESLCLQYRNPYNYFRTKDHLILVHSGIEYFIKYE